MIGFLSPWYFIAICALFAGFLSYFLYRKNRFENKRINRLLALLRFFSLFFIAILLLSPFVKINISKELKPLLAVFIDQSHSLQNNKKYNDNIGAFTKKIEKLTSNFEIQIFPFAKTVTLFSDSTASSKNATDISSIYHYCNDNLESKNLKAAVIISDGIYNKGINPQFGNFSKPVTLFTLGYGDTTRYPDVSVTQINANETVFFQNEFTIEAGIKNQIPFQGNLSVQLLENGKVIQSKTVTGNSEFSQIQFLCKANSIGVRRYTVSVQAVEKEKNLANNLQTVQVEITDTRKKIVLVYHSSHPDIAAVTRYLEENEKYQFSAVKAKDFKLTEGVDAVVAHGMPANLEEQNILKQLQVKKIPVFYILSLQTVPRNFNALETGLQIIPRNNSSNDVFAYVNPNFSDFFIEENIKQNIGIWPPLKIPYANYTYTSAFKILLKQKIASIEMEYPLAGIAEKEGTRNVFLLGEGLWKWKIKDFQINSNFDATNALIGKLLQYTFNTSKAQPFKTYPSLKQYQSDENVTLFAEYYDKNNEARSELPCKGQLFLPNGTARAFDFSSNGTAYKTTIGILPPGVYSYEAQIAGASVKSSNSFEILTNNIETQNLQANFDILRSMASKNNGNFEVLENYSKTIDKLAQLNSGSTTLISETKIVDLIHVKWIALILVLLLGAEWVLRRREGTY